MEPQPTIEVTIRGWDGLDQGESIHTETGIHWHPREDLERRLTEIWGDWLERWVYTGPEEMQHVRPALRVKVKCE